MADNWVVCAGVHSDYATAKADYRVVKDLCPNSIREFGAAVIKRKENSKVQIADKHERRVHARGWHGAGWGLAAGAATALFPAAAIGSGLLAGTTAAGGVIGAISSHVSDGMSRGDLHKIGAELDVGDSAIIVACDPGDQGAVEGAFAGAGKVVSAPMELDQDLPRPRPLRSPDRHRGLSGGRPGLRPRRVRFRFPLCRPEPARFRGVHRSHCLGTDRGGRRLDTRLYRPAHWCRRGRRRYFSGGLYSSTDEVARRKGGRAHDRSAT